MKKLLLALALAGTAAYAPAASAQVSLDLKAGYALPLGDTTSANSVLMLRGALSNSFAAAVPVEVAARWRFNRHLSAGAYFQYDPAIVSKVICLASYTCEGYDMRVGVEVAYAFLPSWFIKPWVSLGTGWEWSGLKVIVPASGNAASGQFQARMNGWEWVNVQVGGDIGVNAATTVGPYVGFFGGTYSTMSTAGMGHGNGAAESIPSDVRSFHGWVQFGLKGSFDLLALPQ